MSGEEKTILPSIGKRSSQSDRHAQTRRERGITRPVPAAEAEISRVEANESLHARSPTRLSSKWNCAESVRHSREDFLVFAEITVRHRAIAKVRYYYYLRAKKVLGIANRPCCCCALTNQGAVSRRTEVVWLCCCVKENRGIRNRVRTNTINRANTIISRMCCPGD